jgi:hypothetical protein
MNRIRLDQDFYIRPEDWMTPGPNLFGQLPGGQLPTTPGVNQQVVAQAPQQAGATGLTATETALLSNEEKAIRLRQRGMA